MSAPAEHDIVGHRQRFPDSILTMMTRSGTTPTLVSHRGSCTTPNYEPPFGYPIFPKQTGNES